MNCEFVDAKTGECEITSGAVRCTHCEFIVETVWPICWRIRRKCPKRSRGLGDTIAKVTKAVGIKPCGGCKERQKKLNKLFPYQQ